MALDVAKGSCICVSGFMFVKFWYLLGKQIFLQIPSTFWVYPLHPTSHFGGQEMQAVPTNMSAMSTIRMLRTNTAGDNAQPPLPPEPCIGHWGRLDGVKAWKVWIEACLRWLFSTIIYNEVTTNRFLVFARLESIYLWFMIDLCTLSCFIHVGPKAWTLWHTHTYIYICVIYVYV